MPNSLVDVSYEATGNGIDQSLLSCSLAGSIRWNPAYDHPRAVEPLERTAEWETGEVEETFPSGL